MNDYYTLVQLLFGPISGFALPWNIVSIYAELASQYYINFLECGMRVTKKDLEVFYSTLNQFYVPLRSFCIYTAYFSIYRMKLYDIT